MKLALFNEVVEVSSLAELHEHLRSRHEGVFGSFWFWHASGTELGVMINGGDACLFFMDANGDARALPPPPLGVRAVEPVTYVGTRNGPSFYSSYSEGVEAPEEEIEFLADNYEATPMTRLYTAPLPLALKAMDDFFETGERSPSLPWLLIEPPPRPEPPPRKAWWRFW